MQRRASGAGDGFKFVAGFAVSRIIGDKALNLVAGVRAAIKKSGQGPGLPKQNPKQCNARLGLPEVIISRPLLTRRGRGVWGSRLGRGLANDNN